MADQQERVSVWNRVKQYHGQGTDEERETLIGPCLGTSDRVLRYLEECVRNKKEIPYFRRGFSTDWKFIDDKLDSLMEGMK